MANQKSDLCSKFGTRIRELRKKSGYSQEEFADHVGMHRTYLGGLERGERNPTLTVIMRLAKGLGISISELTVGIK
ncbi:helix-turn-helix domain-containing protein [Bdellovibrio sp. HCB337]|uniref:helix-turn-helix domain-containing protein n=1 Tax=Bdellovibrio sp. HCB337 TaxID=3394358 RepID=UPI0039A6A629